MSLIQRIDSRSLQPAFRIIKEMSSELERMQATLEKLKNNPTILRQSFMYHADETASLLRKSESLIVDAKTEIKTIFLFSLICSKNFAQAEIAIKVCRKTVIAELRDIENIDCNGIQGIKQVNAALRYMISAQEEAKKEITELATTLRTPLKYLKYMLIVLSAGVIFWGIIRAVNSLDDHNV